MFELKYPMKYYCFNIEMVPLNAAMFFLNRSGGTQFNCGFWLLKSNSCTPY